MPEKNTSTARSIPLASERDVLRATAGLASAPEPALVKCAHGDPLVACAKCQVAAREFELAYRDAEHLDRAGRHKQARQARAIAARRLHRYDRRARIEARARVLSPRRTRPRAVRRAAARAAARAGKSTADPDPEPSPFTGGVIVLGPAQDAGGGLVRVVATLIGRDDRHLDQLAAIWQRTIEHEHGGFVVEQAGALAMGGAA